MYDLEIVLAVCNRGKYAKRLEEFKKHGLLCTGNKKVMLSILTGTEDIPNVTTGWPPDIDVRSIASSVDHCAAKMNSFYASRSLSDAKWVIRVDDDSITKIDPLLNVLDGFDYKDPIYFSTQLVQGDISVELGLLDDFNSKYKNDPLWHEVECCILSKTCFERILNNEYTLSILKKRATIECGYTDICLAACARECGILPSQFYYITDQPELRRFINNEVFHIHFLAPDINYQQVLIAVNDRSQCPIINKKIVISELGAIKGFAFLNDDGTVKSNIKKFDFWTYKRGHVDFWNESMWSEKEKIMIASESQFSFSCETLSSKSATIEVAYTDFI